MKKMIVSAKIFNCESCNRALTSDYQCTFILIKINK